MADAIQRQNSATQRQVNRAQLMAAARYRLAVVGNLRVSEVAHDTGLSSRTVLNHFEGKEDLIGAVLQEDLQVALTAWATDPAPTSLAEVLIRWRWPFVRVAPPSLITSGVHAAIAQALRCKSPLQSVVLGADLVSILTALCLSTLDQAQFSSAVRAIA